MISCISDFITHNCEEKKSELWDANCKNCSWTTLYYEKLACSLTSQFQSSTQMQQQIKQQHFPLLFLSSLQFYPVISTNKRNACVKFHFTLVQLAWSNIVTTLSVTLDDTVVSQTQISNFLYNPQQWWKSPNREHTTPIHYCTSELVYRVI